jgi:hypothetical protein
MEIPDDWQMWTLQKWPDYQLQYTMKVACKIGGHIVEVVGLGESIDQAILEADRAKKDLTKRIIS